MTKGINNKDWKLISFGEMCKNLNESERDPLGKGIDRYVGLEHIETNNLHLTSWGNVSDGTTFTKRFRKGQVLFGKRRAYLRKAAIADFDGICSGDILVFQANEKVIDPNLLPFIVSSDKFFDYAVQTSAGSLSPRTKFQDLAKLQILLPPKSQQGKLAELLWQSDKALVEHERLYNAIQLTLKCAYDTYFSKAKVGSLALGSVAEIVMGQSPDGSTYNVIREGLPLINGPTEFTERFPIKIQWTTKPTKLCQPGDLLLCVRGSTTGRMNVSNDVYCIGRGVAAIRAGNDYMTDFLEHVLIHLVTEIIKLAVGSTFPNIDSKSLKSILIPKYSLNEQKLIVIKFTALGENRDSVLDQKNKIKEIQKQLINQIFG